MNFVVLPNGLAGNNIREKTRVCGWGLARWLHGHKTIAARIPFSLVECFEFDMGASLKHFLLVVASPGFSVCCMCVSGYPSDGFCFYFSIVLLSSCAVL